MLWRQLKQFSHRLYWKFRPQGYRALIIEMSQVAHPDVLTHQARVRLSELHRILGTDDPYRYTPEQEERLRQFNEEIIAKLLAEQRQSRDDQ